MIKSHYGWGVATMVFNQLGQKARESIIKIIFSQENPIRAKG
jgi:hypothetical protein